MLLSSRDFIKQFFSEPEYFYDSEMKYKKIYEDSICKRYFENGILHREDGPAVIYKDNKKPSEYWLNGIKSSKEQVEKLLNEKEDSKKYTLTLIDESFEVTGKEIRELKQYIKSKYKK